MQQVSLYFNTKVQGKRVSKNIIQLHTYIHNWSLQPFSQDY